MFPGVGAQEQEARLERLKAMFRKRNLLTWRGLIGKRRVLSATRMLAFSHICETSDRASVSGVHGRLLVSSSLLLRRCNGCGVPTHVGIGAHSRRVAHGSQGDMGGRASHHDLLDADLLC